LFRDLNELDIMVKLRKLRFPLVAGLIERDWADCGQAAHPGTAPLKVAPRSGGGGDRLLTRGALKAASTLSFHRESHAAFWRWRRPLAYARGSEGWLDTFIPPLKVTPRSGGGPLLTGL
jgi:hypothetical protein